MNSIHSTSLIDPSVQLGNFNQIGKNVQIKYLDEKIKPTVVIGDNNIINDNTRILIGTSPLYIGDWNVFHNDMLVMVGKGINIGHNCWFGQNTILDGTGGLSIANGVRVGMYSQIWTHVASGELVEGCMLFGDSQVTIEDDVWLVGSCVVSSGIHLRKKSVFLINSVITKDSEPEKLYSGTPATINNKVEVWKKLNPIDKLKMLLEWGELFCYNKKYKINNQIELGYFSIESTDDKEMLIFFINEEFVIPTEFCVSLFSILDKTLTKTNSLLERTFYKSIYNNKARFRTI
ncbi:LpxD UDP-3-O-[3-hydroxymyristoyl] [uncultured Caudovirales phage]|uniref:LpxD UDP-3-O-[3-hydroxymyristoyl] n=1 Tax=uncultured Caudovirales phage TaxID=2100421 RepID=A0A6J5MB81_9CAUD|nr:LpxD UDP-3-O-[3-hydroxymyristoyl] [uncultured Caudovirales phage]